MTRYDAIVMGAGQAGPGVAAAVAADGGRVALTEVDRLGGTCLNHGCRPTKALRASARIAHLARRAGEYGVRTGEVTVDFGAVMRRMRAMIDDMRGGLVEWLDGEDRIDVFGGPSVFDGSASGVHPTGCTTGSTTCRQTTRAPVSRASRAAYGTALRAHSLKSVGSRMERSSISDERGTPNDEPSFGLTSAPLVPHSALHSTRRGCCLTAP